MHEQVVGGIVFEAEVVGDSCGHRHGGYAGIADERVDFLRRGEHEVEQFHEQHAGGRCDDEGHKAEGEDENCLLGEERRCLGGGADGHAKKDGDDVGQGVGCRFGQAVGYAALTQQVAEE